MIKFDDRIENKRIKELRMGLMSLREVRYIQGRSLAPDTGTILVVDSMKEHLGRSVPPVRPSVRPSFHGPIKKRI